MFCVMPQKNSKLTPFERWWENTGYFLAIEKGFIGNGEPDAVEIARLAYEHGLMTSPEVISPLKFPSHFVKCTCTCQMLEAEVYNYGDGDKGVNFVIWGRGRQGKKLSKKERIRWCQEIMKNGTLWADDIVATNNDARKLAEFILQNVPKEQIHEETKK